jgi:hypothetical protein
VGSSFACRYLSHDPSKNITHAEAAVLMTGGIDVVSVWESTATRALGGQSAGQQDAHDALVQARAAGLPSGRPIFFAVDFDVQPAQLPVIAQYFRGVHAELDNAGPVNFPQPVPVGVYGGIRVVSSLLNAKAVSYAWQTYAWSHGQLDGRAGLYQFSNGHTVSGVGVDYNHALKADFGQWGFRPPKPKPRPSLHYERYDNRERPECNAGAQTSVEVNLVARYDDLRRQQKPFRHPHRAELDSLRKRLACHAARLESLMLGANTNCKTGENDPHYWCWRHYRLARRAAGKTVKPDKR